MTDGSTFGDWEPDDALDHEPADADQVAEHRRLLERQRLTPAQIEAAIAEWLHEQGADDQ